MAVSLLISGEKNRKYLSDKQFVEGSKDIKIEDMTESHRMEYNASLARIKLYEDERAAFDAARKENDEKIKEFQKNNENQKQVTKQLPKKERRIKEKEDFSELSSWRAREVIVDFIKGREGKTITKSMINAFRRFINVDLVDNFKDHDEIRTSKYFYKRNNIIRKAFDASKSDYIQLSNGATYRKDEIGSIARYTDGNYKMLFNGNLEVISDEDYSLLEFILRGS